MREALLSFRRWQRSAWFHRCRDHNWKTQLQKPGRCCFHQRLKGSAYQRWSLIFWERRWRMLAELLWRKLWGSVRRVDLNEIAIRWPSPCWTYWQWSVV